MRVLHVLSPGLSETEAAQAGVLAEGLDGLLMAAPPGAPRRTLIDLVWAAEPDLVHLHGCAAAALRPAWRWLDLPAVLTPAQADLAPTGRLGAARTTWRLRRAARGVAAIVGAPQQAAALAALARLLPRRLQTAICPAIATPAVELSSVPTDPGLIAYDGMLRPALAQALLDGGFRLAGLGTQDLAGPGAARLAGAAMLLAQAAGPGLLPAAMRAGVAVLAAPGSLAARLLADGLECRWAPASPAAAAALARALAAGGTERERMTSRAAARAALLFSSERVLATHAGLYERILRRHRRGAVRAPAPPVLAWPPARSLRVPGLGGRGLDARG